MVMSENIIQKSVEEMYVQDQAKYSIVVNRRRSLNAVQDGLKPVQRRSLYGAYIKGFKKPSQHGKSAQLTGLVMGEYHPHGDCLHADTRIVLKDGCTTSIEQLYKSGVKSIDVLSVDPATGRLVEAKAHSFRIGQYTNKLYHIILSNGTTIKCTSNHPFMKYDGSWIKAEDIKPNTRLMVKHRVNYNNVEEEYNNGYNTVTMLSYELTTVINSIIDHKYPYTVNACKNIIKDSSLSTIAIEKALNTYMRVCPYVIDVYIEDVDNMPMYDFTVDGLENLVIYTGSHYVTDNRGYTDSYICVHNSSIYDAMATMASWYKIKYPLLYGYGNWGNVSGAKPAAQRYTEVALSDFGYDIMIEELEQSNNIVEWMDTYTRLDKEPEYLPAKLPNILINGAFGIGLGMTINVPSHNLGEVVDATIDLIKNPRKKIVLVPDLIQECDLIGDNWEEISCTGAGAFKIRGRIVTSTDKKGNVKLHIISLPDKVSCTQVYEKILDMVAAKQLPMIKDVKNSLKDKKPDIIIELKQGADVEYVKQAIFAKTRVQDTFSVNFEAVTMDGINLKRFSYKDYLLDFIDGRADTKFRLYCNRLQKVMTRFLEVDAFVKVLQSKEFDKIMNMIRKYNGTDSEPIIEFMIKTCKVTDIQAKFILNRTLPQLSKGHLKRYIEERDDLDKKQKIYLNYVTDDGTLIKNEIIEELKALKKKYNTPRLCRVIDTSHENDIPSGAFKVVITEKNYIRKIPDVDKVGIVRKDNPKFILKVDNAENLLIFDNKGKVFNLPIHKIPITDKQGAGTDIRILVKNLTSDIAGVLYEPILKKISKSRNKHYLTVLTKYNNIKKVDIEDFLNVSLSGLIYSKLKPEDEVVGIALVPHNLDIAICSGHKVLRCKLTDVPLNKRNACGAKAMSTTEPVNGLSVFYPDATDIVVVTRNGKFNRFAVDLLSCNKRAKSGHKVIKLDSTDEILNVYGVNESDTIRVLTTEGVEEILVKDIKVKSSIAAGTKMIKSKGVIVRADIVR
jgi:DNA gyrase/topoisomerase IV subunit A